MERNVREGRRWNIFARELEVILARRGLRLGHLNDRAYIHPEKVRRLQRSLHEPKFHVLPPAELDDICRVFDLTREERIRLRAAVLSTAIEEMLMARINYDDALAAADQVLPILEQALSAHDGEEDGMGAVKGGSFDFDDAPADDISPLLDAALDEMDTALLLLHLGGEGQPARRLQYTTQARDAFASVLKRLDRLPSHADSAWLFWHAEAHSGLAAADKQLVALNH